MTFQMQHWQSRDRAWSPMEDGAARAVWRPRPTREEAVYKALCWTGSPCIPAMRVVDLDTGEVVWQETSYYPDAGAPIVPDWTVPLYEAMRRDTTLDVGEVVVQDTTPPADALFDLDEDHHG